MQRIFVTEYIIDEPKLIMYNVNFTKDKVVKQHIIATVKPRVDGYTYVLRSHEDGNFKPIIEDMVKTIRSAKQIAK